MGAEAPRCGPSTVRNGEGVEKLIKLGRDRLRNPDNIDNGFAALRSTSRLTEYFQRIEAKRATILEDRSRIRYRMGQVFRHKKYGYRGVIFGLDLKCDRPESWMNHHGVDRLPSGTSQPFYFVIPDYDDCVKLFGSYRNTKYVAQDNVVLLNSLESAEIRHPLLKFFFSNFDSECRRYCPLEDVLYQFAEEKWTSNPDALLPLSSPGMEPPCPHRIGATGPRQSSAGSAVKSAPSRSTSCPPPPAPRGPGTQQRPLSGMMRGRQPSPRI